MRRRWLQLGGIGLLVFLVTFLINFPAAWALQLLHARLPVQLAWEDASGTVFDGAASRLSVVLDGGRVLRFENVSLRMSLLPLLLGRMETDFDARGYEGGIQGRAILGPRTWRVARTEGRVSLAAFAEALPEIALLGLSGRLSFSGEGLSGGYRAPPVTGSMNAIVEELRVGLIETGSAIGSYRLSLNADPGEPLDFGVDTPSPASMLIIEGEGTVDSAGGTIRFEGYATAADHATEPVRSLLPLLGPVINGRAAINFLHTF